MLDQVSEFRAPVGPATRAAPRIAIGGAESIEIRHFEDLELVVASKRTPGFTPGQVAALHGLVRDVASGAVGPCKFLAFDLSFRGAAEKPARGFEALVDDLSNLIFQLPVLSVAWVRGDLAGADLELALACSMAVGEERARLTFDIDLVGSLRTYALLAHKVGFVQAERLMEGGVTLAAADAYDAMVLHSVSPPSDGAEGLRGFAASRTRRHNSACGLYRAQRIAMLAAAA